MIEDDIEFAELLNDFLKRFEIEITHYDDPYLGLSAGISKFDLVILDLTMPGMDGLDVCKKIVQYHDIPIIISSSRSDLKDKVEALGIGADDYLLKPYDPNELYARILSLLRRHNKGTKVEEKKCDSISIDPEREVVVFNEKELTLTQAEFDVLKELIRNLGNSVSREQILASSYVMEDSTPKSLDVIINRIRSKMGDTDKRFIKSVRGIGYKLLI